MKKIAILGSTGSIGVQTMDVIRQNPESYSVSCLSCSRSINKIEEQIAEFKPEYVAVSREEDAAYLQNKFKGLTVGYGKDALIQIAKSDADIVLNSLVGIAGLAPSYEAVKKGKTLALANKESLVTGGELIYKEKEKTKSTILPVDSEHSAIFQALSGNEKNAIKNIYLTASGGPFRGYTLEELEKVTLEQALNHPNWSMGKKITIDSASLVNKALEVIEAYWLFGVSAEQIKVLIHPQSVVHSMVEYEDNSVMAQLGTPDMKLPISYALSYPFRTKSAEKPLDFINNARKLEFFEPDIEVFKTLKLAYDAIKAKESYPICFNGANEALVSLFLNEKIKFLDIQNTLIRVLDEHKPLKIKSLEDVFAVDAEAREIVYKILKSASF